MVPKKDITIICVSYKRYKDIHVLINSFICQTIDNWKLLVIHDGPDQEMEKIVSAYSRAHENIKYMSTEDRFNDWGHSLRAMGLEMVDTEFVMFTNDDNYYVPKFLEYMFGAIRKNKLDFVICNMIHSHVNPGQYIQDDYNVFDSYPKMNYIDIGNFIIKTSIAKEVGFKGRSFAADGEFADEIVERYSGKINFGKVEKILYVHN